MKPVVIDLFAGRLGWSTAFLEFGWRVVAYDLELPSIPIPEGVEYILRDVLTLTADDLRAHNPQFAVCSSPCEKFSVHGMKHFHPNPPPPTSGVQLFEHSYCILSELGVPFVMENVAPAEKFIGKAVNHCGPFYMWGTGVPALFPKDAYKVTKGMDVGSSKVIKGMTAQEKRDYRAQFVWNQAWSSFTKRQRDTAKAATIPPLIARTVAESATRMLK